MPNKSRFDNPDHDVLMAVVKGDYNKIMGVSGATGETKPYLLPANQALEDLVSKTLALNPRSELATHLANMLHRGELFEMVGKWPPDGATGSAVQQCPQCGHIIAQK